VTQAVRCVVLAAFVVVFLGAPWVIRALNPLFKPFLRVGLPGGPNVLLTVLGRTSGRPRSVPVALLQVADRQFVQASYGEVDWVRNLRTAREAILTNGRIREPVRSVELDPETAARLMHDALASYPRSAVVSKLVGPIERPPVGVLQFFRLRIDETLDDYLAEARRHPIFELRRVITRIGSRRPARSRGSAAQASRPPGPATPA
jgi:deazaflavin-dependent oxidoreductase (nitroreductase family)